MGRLIELDDPSDERLDSFVRLRDVSLRQRLETRRGIYLAEGEKVIRRAHAVGHEFESFLLAPRWLSSLRPIIDSADAPAYVLADSQIETLTGFHVHRGALAAVHRPPHRAPQDILASARRVLLLEDLADHANVGAIFRSAAAFGFDGILLSPRCADPWYRRAIKTSMGAVFSIPFARCDDWFSTPELIAEHGLVSVALTLADDSVAIDQLDLTDRPVAAMIGSEGHGLSQRWQAGADYRVRIPIAAGVDSLNAAAAAAVACWHLRAT